MTREIRRTAMALCSSFSPPIWVKITVLSEIRRCPDHWTISSHIPPIHFIICSGCSSYCADLTEGRITLMVSPKPVKRWNKTKGKWRLGSILLKLGCRSLLICASIACMQSTPTPYWPLNRYGVGKPTERSYWYPISTSRWFITGIPRTLSRKRLWVICLAIAPVIVKTKLHEALWIFPSLGSYYPVLHVLTVDRMHRWINEYETEPCDPPQIPYW